MKISSAFQSGIQGIQRGIHRVERMADDIAKNGSAESFDPVSNTESLFKLNLQNRNI